MLDIAFKDLKTKKGRTAMVIVGVMTCVLLIGVISYIAYDLQQSIQVEANIIAGKLVFEKNGTGYPPAGSIIPQNISDQVLANSVVNPNESSGVLLISLPINSTTIIGLDGITPGKEQTLINGTKVNGKDSLLGESDNSVILGSQAAKNLNVTVGDTFTANNHQFNVIGVLARQGIASPTPLDGSIIASLPFAQNLSQTPGIVTVDLITPNNGVSLQDAQNTLQNQYNFNNTYSIYTQNDALQTLNQNESASYVFLDLIVALILIVSAILIMVVMMMSVKEKTKDIGTMRALGTSKTKILLLIFYESLIISLIGGLIGIILIIPVYNLFLLLAGSTSFTYSIPISTLIEVVFVVFVIGTFSGLIPAYLATRISPIEALRYE